MITWRGAPQMTGQASGALKVDARRALLCAKNAIVHANYANGCAVTLAWRRCDTAFRVTWCRRFLRCVRRRNDKNDKAGLRLRAPGGAENAELEAGGTNLLSRAITPFFAG